uniref:Retroviral polymerase SH3-like domain-containing protein n=1 Tax=Tanacetum cinerariifolium TaxID=118510 RepID=A0A6L2M3Q3_TANCI|nr:hypothetical protein [Tanacetum cinerariifolium]
MMKGSDIGIQEKKAKRNKHFPEKIASNLKFLNNLQPEWSQHVIIVHQTKDLHTTYYTQFYDFLKYNQKEVDDLRAERLAKTHDPLALMENSNNPYNYLVFHLDQPSPSTYMQQPLPNNKNYNPQPSLNQDYMQQPMPNHKYITDPTTTMNMALVLIAKAFKLNYSTPTSNNQRILSNLRNRQIAQSGMNFGQDRQMQIVGAQAKGNVIRNNGNQIRCYNCRGLGYLARNYTLKPRRRDVAYLQTQLLIAQKEEARIQLQAEEFNLMDAAADLDENEEVNANCILMANLQQELTSGTQTNKAPVYDSNRSAEVHEYENCYNNEIFNMFTQEEQYTEILKPIPEPHQVQQNNSNVIYKVIEVEKFNTVNHKLRETNADLTTELAGYKNQEMCFEISQEKYDKLERCYQKSVYQEKCLTKKINALLLSSDKQITALNEEIANLNNQLSKEKSTVSSLQEEKKKLKSDFKIREDVLLDKQIQLENKIKELDEQKMALGIKSTAKTRRSQSRSNTKNDMVSSTSKSSCIKNKKVKVEEHHRNLMFYKNKIHMSSECNNIKLAIQNDKFKVVCAMFKQCLIAANHDVCVLNYVNDMNSRGKKQKANVSKITNQMKHKPHVKKSKKVGSPERLASPKPSKPRSCLSTPQQNRVLERRNQTLVAAARTMLIFSRVPLFLWAEAIATAYYSKNLFIIHRRFNKTPYELINDKKPDISCLHAFGALCYLKNDREDIRKLSAKDDIGFFIGYSAKSCTYRVYNRRINKMIETMNVTFDELSAMAFEQSSLKPMLQSMTSGQISSGLDLIYAPSTITTQQPTKCELDLLFEAMYDDYVSGQL